MLGLGILFSVLAGLMLCVLVEIASLSPKVRTWVQASFSKAGWYSPSLHRFWWIFVGFLGMGGALSSAYFFYHFIMQGLHSPTHIIITVFPVYAGVLIPLMLLRATQRKYERAIRKEVISVLSILIVYLEAGYPIERAFDRVMLMLAPYHFKMLQELWITRQELRLLGNREEAWNRLVTRAGCDEAMHFGHLLQSAETSGGVHVIEQLILQRRLLFMTRTRQLEIDGAKAGVYMSIPLVVCILPVLFIVTLGPVLVLTLQILFGVS
ncbi:MAG: hypothetical protein A3J38_08025 [Gammaproteobacteria bacterium RIFCSPHIGHO2_12_FULL_45_9]|nr:MAG: hypothetical protein A3J38_08025 [Gammaproteobacteria bacterium RIFCSPHIGHO2_12_FULL_45_9]